MPLIKNDDLISFPTSTREPLRIKRLNSFSVPSPTDVTQMEFVSRGWKMRAEQEGVGEREGKGKGQPLPLLSASHQRKKATKKLLVNTDTHAAGKRLVFRYECK